MNRKWIAFTGAAAAVAFAAWLSLAEAATTPFGVSPPPEQGGSPIGGPLSPIFMWIAFAQQHFYGDLVERMADIQANPVAIWALLGLSFLYGVFHAAGPGHGKAVISGYLVATGDTARRGILLSFAAAFVQALSAILVVAIAGAILHVTAVTMSAATSWFEVASSGLIAAVGAWLLWSKTLGGHTHAHFHAPGDDGHDRGHDHAAHDHHDHPAHHHDNHIHENERDEHDHDRAAEVRTPSTIRRSPLEAADVAVFANDRHDDGHEHDHPHHVHAHSEHDADDEHDHDFAAVAEAVAAPGRATTGRALSAIFAVGIRPCSGALIILVFSLSQGLFVVGIAATLVMALGTGLTVAVLATLAVVARSTALRFTGTGSARAERLVHAAEIAVAALVLVFGLVLLGGSLVNGLPGTS